MQKKIKKFLTIFYLDRLLQVLDHQGNTLVPSIKFLIGYSKINFQVLKQLQLLVISSDIMQLCNMSVENKPFKTEMILIIIGSRLLKAFPGINSLNLSLFNSDVRRNLTTSLAVYCVVFFCLGCISRDRRAHGALTSKSASSE
jgi:hypothetical protein